MSLVYRSLVVWGYYEEADYILHKNLALPSRAGSLFTKITSDGLVISSSYRRMNKQPTLKTASSGIITLIKEDLINVVRPTLLAYQNMQSVKLDEKRGMFEVIYNNESLKFRITSAHKLTLQEATKSVKDLFLEKGIPVEDTEFKITERYNKFVIFLVIITVFISVLAIANQ